MNKILKTKKWMNLADAAKYLSSLIQEEVVEADILYLALDNKLPVFIDIVNGARAQPGRIVPADEAPKIIGLSGKEVILGTSVGNNSFLVLEDRVVSLSNIYELPMVGGEILELQQMHNNLTDGPDITNICLDGVLVRNGDQYFQLLEDFKDNEFFADAKRNTAENSDSVKVQAESQSEVTDSIVSPMQAFRERNAKRSSPSNYYPAPGLPTDAVLLFKNVDLVNVEKTIGQAADGAFSKPLSTKESDTVLTIIAALCNYSDIKFNDRGVAVQIAKLTEELGAGVHPDTVRKWLNMIPAALEARRSK